MREEMEFIWNAMKDSHYRRTIEQLTKSIQEVRSLDEALPVMLKTVLYAIHAQTGSGSMIASATAGSTPVWPARAPIL